MLADSRQEAVEARRVVRREEVHLLFSDGTVVGDIATLQKRPGFTQRCDVLDADQIGQRQPDVLELDAFGFHIISSLAPSDRRFKTAW